MSATSFTADSGHGDLLYVLVESEEADKAPLKPGTLEMTFRDSTAASEEIKNLIESLQEVLKELNGDDD